MALRFGTHLIKDTLQQGREALLGLFVEESVRSGGPAHLRTWTEGSRWTRRGLLDGAAYNYRAVLPNELVYDIGDNDEDGNARPWADTIRDVSDLLVLLNWLGEPFVAALTDGKGWHVHIFLERGVDRETVARAIVASIHAGRPDPLSQPFIHDRRLVAPGEGSRQVREFGAKKSGSSPIGKAIWAVGPGPFEAIPATREATYARLRARLALGEDLAMPRAIVRGMPLVHLAPLQAQARSNGGLCPKGPECLPGPHRDAMDWSWECGHNCPVNA